MRTSIIVPKVVLFSKVTKSNKIILKKIPKKKKFNQNKKENNRLQVFL